MEEALNFFSNIRIIFTIESITSQDLTKYCLSHFMYI